MTFSSTTLVHVSYCPGKEKISLGRLAFKDRKIFFEYNPGFIEKELQLSPFKLPLQPGVMACENREFDGLFGVFNDSLPDGWGCLLLDRKLMKMGINPSLVTPLDRLCYVGIHGMGALRYEPEFSDGLEPHFDDLDLIAAECLQVLEDDDDRFIDDLLVMNGSSAGARPKILVNLRNKDEFKVTNNKPSVSSNDWIIKFSSSTDPKDIGPIEYAYHLMAKAAGLDVPKARLFKSKKTKGYFGVKRFDHQDGQFIHMHTMSGLLHIDHRLPSLDYETLMRATLWLTKDIRECEKQFRHAVFNVLAHNRDDHAKNFSFLMDAQGVWHVSPAYDLTFSAGPAGEHCTTMMGEGKKPGRPHFLKLADVIGIKQQQALEMIDQVKEAISGWLQFAEEADVNHLSAKNIATVLNGVLRDV